MERKCNEIIVRLMSTLTQTQKTVWLFFRTLICSFFKRYKLMCTPPMVRSLVYQHYTYVYFMQKFAFGVRNVMLKKFRKELDQSQNSPNSLYPQQAYEQLSDIITLILSLFYPL